MSDPAGMLSCRVVSSSSPRTSRARSRRSMRALRPAPGDCERCAAYLDQMRETIRLVGTLDTESIDLEACNRLMHAFRSWKAAPGQEDGP